MKADMTPGHDGASRRTNPIRQHVLCIAIAGALVASASIPAVAGFVVVEPPPVLKEPLVDTAKEGFRPLVGSGLYAVAETPPRSALKFTGSAPSDVEIRRGFGRDMRLADALRMIAPEGWRGFGLAEVADTFDADKRVNWKGGQPWTLVLEQLAREQGLQIEVDWTARRLYVGRAPAPASAPILASADAGAGAPEQAVSVAAPGAAIGRSWLGKSGTTVRSTVEEWAATEGWSVVWPMEDLDYRIAVELRFNGSLVDATSKLTQLYERADRPLAVDIHVNQKLIVFSEKGTAL